MFGWCAPARARSTSSSRRRPALDPSDVAALVTLMRDHDLRELEVERAGTRVRLVRAEPRDTQPPAARATATAGSAGAAGSAGSDGTEAAAATGRAITSPMVGTFHRAPAAGAPAFVETGDLVDRGQVLCVIEAMKMMNEIEAEFRGRVAEILIDNGAPVEYGEALFIVEPL